VENTPTGWVPMNDLVRALTSQRCALTTSFERVLDAGWLIGGPQVDTFERALSHFVGVDHTVGVANGTDALEIALRSLMPTGRHTVVTAANCGGYTTVAALRANFRVSFADIDPETLLLDSGSVETIITDNDDIGVVVATHLYGRASDIDSLKTLCEPLGIKILEDCAQAIGAEQADQRVGGLGDAGAFSFYPTKNLGALGDGGAITTNDKDVARKARALHQYGWDHKYEITQDGGRNSRLDELQAALLLARLPQLEQWNERRRQIIARYSAAASDRISVLPTEGRNHVGHLAVVLTDDRDELRHHMEEHKVRTDIHYPIPDYRQPALTAHFPRVSLPVTEHVVKRILSVPVFPEMAEAEIEQVCDALATF